MVLEKMATGAEEPTLPGHRAWEDEQRPGGVPRWLPGSDQPVGNPKEDHAMKEPQKMWAVFNRRGRMVMTRAGGTEHDTLRHYGDSIGVSKKILADQGYTCREGEVKEVEG